MTSEIDKLKHFYIDCVEIEIAPDNWIMAVDANNTNLLYYRSAYNVSKRRK